MQFGKVLHPENIDFFLPKDPAINLTTLNQCNTDFRLSVGCAKWNKQDLKKFYPKGTKDELAYYATQFNSIELNASFYNLYPKAQFEKWASKTPSDFRFFPKIPKQISHEYLLNTNAIAYSKLFIENIRTLKKQLGGVFLQLHESFAPNDFSALGTFITNWPTEIPLAIELRHTDWFYSPSVATALFNLFKTHNITTIITDTAGRRDLLHMALTTPKTFIRFVGANHPTDYIRIDQWVARLQLWKKQGIEEVNFFVHQNTEIESVKLAAYFIKQMNLKLDLNHIVPKTQNDSLQTSLF